MDHIFLNT